MKRRKIEKYMKDAMKIDAPESVWERIKSDPILVYTDSNRQRKGSGKTYRRAAVCVVAAFVIIAAVAAINKGNVFQQPPIIGENSTDSGNSLFITDDDTTLSAAPISGETQEGSYEQATTSSSGIDSGISMGVCVSCYMVLDHRLYSANCESGLMQADLGAEYTEMQNEYKVTVYSIKGVPINESFAIKANGMIIRYDFIFDGEFEIDGEKYGIVDRQAYFYPEPQKGDYLGTVGGMKVYEFSGNDEAVLIDLNPIVAIDGDTDEFLYAAEKIS